MGTILADPPLPNLSVSDAAPVIEPPARTKAFAQFTVSLSAPSQSTVLVHVTTQDGTATAGADYIPVNLDLKFKPGETQKTVTVRIVHDRVPDGTENFTLILSQPIDALIARGTAIGTIRDS